MTDWDRLDRVLKWMHEHEVRFFLSMVALLGAATFFDFF